MTRRTHAPVGAHDRAGKPRQHFSGNPEKQELDTVSDRYVAQTKPDDFDQNKAFRDDVRGGDTGLIDVRWMNGTLQVHFAGFPNHRSSAEDLVDFFRWIGSIAPGSHGLLNYWDDEDRRGQEYRNQFEVLVMTRGKVAEHTDTFRSPCAPTIEDP